MERTVSDRSMAVPSKVLPHCELSMGIMPQRYAGQWGRTGGTSCPSSGVAGPIGRSRSRPCTARGLHSARTGMQHATRNNAPCNMPLTAASDKESTKSATVDRTRAVPSELPSERRLWQMAQASAQRSVLSEAAAGGAGL